MRLQKAFLAALMAFTCTVQPLALADLNSHEAGIQTISYQVNATAKKVAVPAETVLNVALAQTISTKDSQLGQMITASVKDPVYVGPHLVVPEGSTLLGKITDINRTAQKKGPNPYIVVDFTQLQRPGEARYLPFSATLIAYKTGLRKGDYVWRLPQKQDKWRARLSSTLEGAVTGLFINPVLGPLIGGGAGALKAVAVDRVAEKGSIKVKAGEVIPIAVHESFQLPVTLANRI